MSNYELYCGDCLEVLPGLDADVCITDPPYGAGKAEWDSKFHTEWYSIALSVCALSVIITGATGLKDSVPLVGGDLIDVIAARNLNALTRSGIGFSNWIAAVVAGKRVKKKNVQNFFEFAVRGDMPDHPSPKPIEYMIKLVIKTSNPGDTIIDPFMGSGTTGVACARTGRNFIGIEIDKTYFDIAEKRIREAYMQPPLFVEVEKKAKPVQGELFGGVE